MSFPSPDPDEQLKPIEFDFADRDLILDLWTIESDIESRFKLAPVKGKRIVVEMNAFDLDELLGSIAAIANHEKNAKRRRKLDDLFKRISDTLETQFPQ
jgi:hypothetical protein